MFFSSEKTIIFTQNQKLIQIPVSQQILFNTNLLQNLYEAATVIQVKLQTLIFSEGELLGEIV